MSALDKIEYEVYTANRPQDKNGDYISITPKTRTQLKELMLNLVNSVPMDNQTYERLCKKIEAL